MSGNSNATTVGLSSNRAPKNRMILSPRQLLVVIAVGIFIFEALIMLFLGSIPRFSREVEALIDSSVLLLLLTPLYYYVYRPFWEERQQYQRQIQYLSQQLLKATEEERKRITHELHDQCGQTMTALQFGMQALKKRLNNTGPEVTDQIDHLVGVTAQLAGEIRELTTRLRPAVLDELGLFAALRWQIEEFCGNFPDIKLKSRMFRESDLEQRLEPQVEDALYRICQEALTNIVRHARASEVTFRLWQENHFLFLSVADNGIGFDLDQCWLHHQGACGIGLLGMRERAANLGGTLQINSQPGKGTTIQVSFPMLKESKV